MHRVPHNELNEKYQTTCIQTTPQENKVFLQSNHAECLVDIRRGRRYFSQPILSTTIHGIQRRRSIQEIQVYIIITTAT